MGDYRKLLVWQRARALEQRVRSLVERLPPVERARVGDQVIRAVESIRFNIAEGCGLNADSQLARHLLIALGSANEAQDELDSVDEAKLLGAEDQDLKTETSGIRAMIVGLHRRVAGRRTAKR